MKFKRNHMREILKIKTFGPTPRRLAAARKALQLQREKCPLFAEEIAAGQPTPEERIKAYDRDIIERMHIMRQFTAYQWRKGRRELKAIPENEQQELLNYWNLRKFGPLSSEYFADLVTNWKKRRKL